MGRRTVWNSMTVIAPAALVRDQVGHIGWNDRAPGAAPRACRWSCRTPKRADVRLFTGVVVKHGANPDRVPIERIGCARPSHMHARRHVDRRRLGHHAHGGAIRRNRECESLRRHRFSQCPRFAVAVPMHDVRRMSAFRSATAHPAAAIPPSSGLLLSGVVLGIQGAIQVRAARPISRRR